MTLISRPGEKSNRQKSKARINKVHCHSLTIPLPNFFRANDPPPASFHLPPDFNYISFSAFCKESFFSEIRGLNKWHINYKSQWASEIEEVCTCQFFTHSVNNKPKFWADHFCIFSFLYYFLLSVFQPQSAILFSFTHLHNSNRKLNSKRIS